MGRLYLFGPEIDFPLVADGSLMVELYDDRPRQSGGAPVMLEQWRLDKDTLRCLRRRDTIGWGYTLFLPWGSYKPAIGQVHLRLRYDPLKGPPLFTDSGPLTLSATPDAVPPPLVPPAARGASTAGKPAMLPPAAPAPSSNGQPGLDPGKLAR